jgi:hypothetical protein
MDPSVVEALKRWPDVPAVDGWLSLDRNGRWRLHPGGDAVRGGPGEAIENAGLVAFINRNYAHDETGRWFFQNGPQRVYVRLDAAPYILRVQDDGTGLQTHTGVPVRDVTAWWLDGEGRLYAQTDAGPGMVEGRDLPQVTDAMLTLAGDPALEPAGELPVGQCLQIRHPACPRGAPLRRSDSAIGTLLGFLPA